MNERTPLNEFQTKCVESLEEQLAARGFAVEGVYTQDTFEGPFVHGHVPDGRAEFYIYIDGADFRGWRKPRARRYERQDYETLDLLSRAFVIALVEACVDFRDNAPRWPKLT